MKRVFSGVQPTGNIHLGNYLGAFQQFVELQQDHDCIYCIVDLHSITLPQDPAELQKNILDVAATFIAVGVDPKKSILFVQSTVPGHSELAWILLCNTYMGELSRMTQFKDKGKGRDVASAGLFTYPVLQAADILIYDAHLVPVGSDQKQHIELCRDIAIRVNNKYGDDTFIVPDGRFLKEGARIMALDDPSRKMSKSAENMHACVSLLDDDKKIETSFKKATTDSGGEVRFDPENKPGISNLLTIYSALAKLPVAEIEKKYEGLGYGIFKKELTEVTIETLRPIRARFHEIRDSGELAGLLADGACRAGEIAEKTIQRVRQNFGLGV